MPLADELLATASERLATFFDPTQPRECYSDTDIDQIALLLGRCAHAASRCPRTYIILRMIGELELLEELLSLGFDDQWFPVEPKGLPQFLSPSVKARIVQTQNVILTKSLDLERGRHRHFTPGETLPFEVLSRLGSGNYGQVDRIESSISFRQYALKRIRRRTAFGKNSKAAMSQFLGEIQIVKSLKHRHIIEYIGSYTDKTYLGLVTYPVADSDLSVFLNHIATNFEVAAAKESGFSLLPSREKAIATEQAATLRTYFGCLAAALAYLHDRSIRHKDIKPQNILVHKGNVILTDFGLSRDFADDVGSTTSGATPSTPRYSPPEVATFDARNTSADIWSLGCVFFEMCAALHGHNVEWLKRRFTTTHTKSSFFYANHEAATQLLSEWESAWGNKEKKSLQWVRTMLRVDRFSRPTAATLLDNITSNQDVDYTPTEFCGICCIPDEDTASEDSIVDDPAFHIVQQALTLSPTPPAEAVLSEFEQGSQLSLDDAASTESLAKSLASRTKSPEQTLTPMIIRNGPAFSYSHDAVAPKKENTSQSKDMFEQGTIEQISKPVAGQENSIFRSSSRSGTLPKQEQTFSGTRGPIERIESERPITPTTTRKRSASGSRDDAVTMQATHILAIREFAEQVRSEQTYVKRQEKEKKEEEVKVRQDLRAAKHRDDPSTFMREADKLKRTEGEGSSPSSEKEAHTGRKKTGENSKIEVSPVIATAVQGESTVIALRPHRKLPRVLETRSSSLPTTASTPRPVNIIDATKSPLKEYRSQSSERARTAIALQNIKYQPPPRPARTSGITRSTISANRVHLLGQDAWSWTNVMPEEVQELIRICTSEIKSKALDSPFVLLPFRPSSDHRVSRKIIRNYFNDGSKVQFSSDALSYELSFAEPQTLCSVIKWCWSRLPGGVVTWDVYELFRIGESDSNFARQSFEMFVPISTESKAHMQIIFDFFDLLSAVAARAKSNGMGGRKLSRLAGWWAFDVSDKVQGFDDGYRAWENAANAASHLFFAYLRSLDSNQPPRDPYDISDISNLPRSLQNLLRETEYPPLPSALMQQPTSKVTMIVDSGSPSPLALLRRTRGFQYRDDDHALQDLSTYGDITKALSEECRRVLDCVSKVNQPDFSFNDSTQEPSWSRFEDLGFSGFSEPTPPGHSGPSEDLEPGELCKISSLLMDNTFWWVWMSSLAPEEALGKKAAFGRSLVMESKIRGAEWVIMEELVKSDSSNPERGAYIPAKKSRTGFLRRYGRKK